jgi:methylated-DNA-[protein]-cysteine S-methyltransferase
VVLEYTYILIRKIKAMQDVQKKTGVAKKAKNYARIIIKSEDVYDMLLTIPAGMVSTYGDLAKALGSPTASRHIGKILSKNPNPIVVPCHRVVKSDGNLGGYALGSSKKKELLEGEGVLLADDLKINEFKKIRFYPRRSQ